MNEENNVTNNQNENDSPTIETQTASTEPNPSTFKKICAFTRRHLTVLLIISLVVSFLVGFGCGRIGTVKRSVYRNLLTRYNDINEQTQNNSNASAAQSSDNPLPTEEPASNKNAIFDSYNVVDFQLTNEDRTSYSEEVICTFTATNNFNEPVKELMATFAYYDANGNTLCTDTRSSDAMIEAGKFVTLKSYSGVDGNKDAVASAEVISYTYFPMTEPKEGYNAIEVNLQTKEVFYKSYTY